jgi:hypothetical protein
MNGFDLPNFAGEANALRDKLRTVELMKKKTVFSDIDINEPITYYKCIYHKKIYCDDCTHNFGNKKLPYHLAPKCNDHILTQKDCIWEKFELDKNQKLTCSWCKEEIK